MPTPPPPEPREPRRPRVFTVPFGASFLDALAGGLLDGGLIPGVALRTAPLALADVTIFLPTRRAGSALGAALVERLGGAAFLPRIVPLGEADDEDDLGDDGELAAAAARPAVGELERLLVLARLVQQWAKSLGEAIVPRRPGDPLLVPGSPADAAALAAELARLIDSFATEGVAWPRLQGLVPVDLDLSWQLIVRFLAIASQWWPDYLAARGLGDRAELRNARLRAFAARLRQRPPTAPVIVAGSTGSNPATAELMAAIARLPQGAVVLPGLDRDDLDAAAWAEVARDDAAAWTHPQHVLAGTLTRLGLDRADIADLGAAPLWAVPRRRLVADALRPASTTEAWASSPTPPADGAAALAGLSVIAARNEQEEALAAALLLREAVERPGGTAALVTPDRGLARRVAAELARWGLAVEDSAGVPLSDAPAGILARLIAETAAADFAPAALLPLLKHAGAGFGRSSEQARRAAAAIELGALRGPRPAAGAEGLRTALAQGRARATTDRHAHRALRKVREWEWRLAEDHLARLLAALAPLGALGCGTTTLGALAAAHAEALAAAAASDFVADAVLAELDAIAAAEGADLPLRLGDYPALITGLLGRQVARPPAPGDARIVLLGTLEARLLAFDRVVLGGLIEGVWPPAAHNDPWLSRPMRRELGLPPPEWRIGLSAHDLQQALGHREVALTYAAKAAGAPTVPARWLQRLAVVGGDAWKSAQARGEATLVLARRLDAAAPAGVIAEPRPAPALALRPARLSVTEIETLIRDPYAIYARRILGLDPLEPIDAPPDAGDRGEILHDAFARFVAAGIDPAAPDARDRLLGFGLAAFAPLADRPEVRAFWWPRFCRAADWFLGWAAKRQGTVAESFVERAGRLAWTTVAGRAFALTARADRFDRLADGGFAVLDYKTGKPPTPKEVASGMAPQLPLEAAMLARGAFADVPAATATALLYIHLSGNRVPGAEKDAAQEKPAAELGEETLRETQKLIDRFEDEAFPYRALRHPLFRYRGGGPYEHLARVQEWARVADEDEGE